MAKNKKKKDTGLIEDGTVARNREARFKYEILDTMEAGVVLLGSEVKALRHGEASLKESFAFIKHGEVWLINAYIPPYEPSTRLNHEPTRKRKLLLHSREIQKIGTETKQGGITLVPLEIYFNARGIAKIRLALARGKKTHDKRQTIKKRDVARDLRRRMMK